jgi:hypothetical protein
VAHPFAGHRSKGQELFEGGPSFPILFLREGGGGWPTLAGQASDCLYEFSDWMTLAGGWLTLLAQASNRLYVLRVPHPFAHSAKGAWQYVKINPRFRRAFDLPCPPLTQSSGSFLSYRDCAECVY